MSDLESLEKQEVSQKTEHEGVLHRLQMERNLEKQSQELTSAHEVLLTYGSTTKKKHHLGPQYSGTYVLDYAQRNVLHGQNVKAGGLSCGRGFMCKDGSQCLSHTHVCDGENDCEDGSDEQDCAVMCGKDEFQCAHGKKCLDKKQVCDGVPQCQDRSDELACMTQIDGCVHHCDNMSRCLPANLLCDGEQDCLDGTDEANCEEQEVDKEKDEKTTSAPSASVGPPAHKNCPLSLKHCKNNIHCVHYNHFCDGDVDCPDGSDEEDCPSQCEADQFQCAYGRKCINQTQVCDGVNQCQDRSDELLCGPPMEDCDHQCDGKSRCIPNSFVCDGEADCLDGSDEANCANQECSAAEFLCTSGQCVSATMRCDGHPDCRDRSDEKGCAKAPVCTTNLYCPQSMECLVQDWKCDGDQDCKDGTDEKDCPAVLVDCGEFQWQCQSKTMCIPTAWRCDGMKDCNDGSDETKCGAQTCLPHQFQCGSQECLDPVLLCNGNAECADGSDEGGNCQLTCTQEEISRCAQSCYSTPQGTHCGCSPGFMLMDDGLGCADIDECESRSSVCSQLCVNTHGSYQCQCHPGYIMEADGYRCKITGEPFLLTSLQTDLFMLGLRSGSLEVLSSSTNKAILSLDYDWKEQKVIWANLETKTIRWSSINQKKTGTLLTDVRADSVAVDWLGRNLYWIDGVNSQIVAARLATRSVKSQGHSIILDEDLDQPRSLALLPQKGLMFWTEIGNEVKIERAGMDGSERTAIVNSSLGWPGGVAVDILDDRVYWTDERLQAIGSATLDGEDIRILKMKAIANPFSLVVFNDLIYWSDTEKRLVQAAHKITGKNRLVLLKRPRQPFGVRIMHPLLQMGTNNPCQEKDCSHLCVLAPGPKAVCKCPSGLLLAEDGLTCSSLVNSAFLLILSPFTVTQIYLQSRHTAVELNDWPEHLALQVPNINEAAIMDYSLRDHTLLLTDDATSSLSSFKLKDKLLVPHSQLLKVLGDSITAMALDWITLNFYWSSSKQPRLEVTSITAKYTAVIIKDSIDRLESVALHPPSGRVCFTNLGLQGADTSAAVECAHMDGAERSVVWKDAVQPTSLVFSNNGDTIYWADTGSGVIGSILLDGSGFKELKTSNGLTAVALSDDTLFWMTVGDKARLWYRDEQQQNKLWFQVNTKVVSLKVFSKSRQTGTNKCAVNNGNCQHLCLATPGGRTCKCGYDQNAINCTAGQHCPAGSSQCLDQLPCQPEKFCNIHTDCLDHSDKNCVSVKQVSGSEMQVSTQPHRFSSPPPSLAPPTPEPTTLNASSHLRNLDAQQCSQRRCSSNGHCVEVDGEVACDCTSGYSGDSCQEPLMKSMQASIIYGAAGLCAAVVLITVLAVVVKRRNPRSRLSVHVVLLHTPLQNLPPDGNNWN
ncbi:very low-density lipoprotein receptor [Thalassophryne amazonica]|uniref:very low-density lipoprotein receptor n=1 Tax=Thalassophryne amazonica TaxID=390379 RepID=UPI0014709F4E|nr:very low-density lipoprotein receptor [Thalassophryne amazonica]